MNTDPLRYFAIVMLIIAMAYGVVLAVVGFLSKLSGLPGWLMMLLGGAFVSILAGFLLDWVAS